MEKTLINDIIKEYQFLERQVITVLNLLEENNTVPFIARYRKEATGGLDEVQIRQISDGYQYVAHLQERKEEVIHNIGQQDLLTNELKQDILRQTKLQRIEDLCRPFRQKKKARATKAKRKGLAPLAHFLIEGQSMNVHEEARKYLGEEVKTVDEAIQGTQDIIAERISDNPKCRQRLLKDIYYQGKIVATKEKQANNEKEIFSVYYDYSEPVRRIANHRILAMDRGEKERILSIKIEFDTTSIETFIQSQEVKKTHQLVEYIESAVKDSLKHLIMPSIEREIRNGLTERAEHHTIEVFSENLKHLLLQPPMKGKQILGIDSAFRAGCKLAVINPFGTFIAKSVIYPHPPESKIELAEKELVRMITENNVELIAISDGTTSRETEQFVANVIKKYQLSAQFIIINEAGASVYSASKIARNEFPEFQVEERSAVSIGRRVQDPLSELVKIDPKSIGIGQYQHDVNQKELEQALTFVVETAVNQVGVNVNTTSKSLLQYVSGLSGTIAQNIIDYRKENRSIKHHSEISKVKRLGSKTFEQSIGFLRIVNGKEPLDNTSTHPESYQATYQFLESLQLSIDDFGSDKLKQTLSDINIEEKSNEIGIGKPTLEGVVKSLKTPSRDPRDNYETPQLKSDILSIEDLSKGMKLSGTVRNVIDFEAFVGIGVRQDGLVHVSKLSRKYVKNPMDIINVGNIVDVWILNIDKSKEKVSLTMINPNE